MPNTFGDISDPDARAAAVAADQEMSRKAWQAAQDYGHLPQDENGSTTYAIDGYRRAIAEAKSGYEAKVADAYVAEAEARDRRRQQ